MVLQIALLDSLQKIFEGFGVLSLTFEGVTDIVEQLGVTLIDSQTGTKDGLLRFPVKVAGVRLQTVENEQEQETQMNCFRPTEMHQSSFLSQVNWTSILQTKSNQTLV
jgi:hypothetical protein